MNRRDFIRHSLLVAGSLAATRALGTNPFSNEKQKNKENIMMDYVTLNNGVRVCIASNQNRLAADRYGKELCQRSGSRKRYPNERYQPQGAIYNL